MSSNQQATRPSTAFKAATQSVSIVALALAVLFALVLVVIPTLTGSQTYSVLTSSMKPNYGPGTLLIVKPADFMSLKTGDVITYQLESGRPEVITHRIVSIAANQEGKRQLITQGDNNDVVDETPVSELQIRGKLLYAVPVVGYAANWLGNQNRSVIGQLIAVALIGYGTVNMIRGIRARCLKKNTKTASTSEPVLPSETQTHSATREPRA